jgi:hypothetical protein
MGFERLHHRRGRRNQEREKTAAINATGRHEPASLPDQENSKMKFSYSFAAARIAATGDSPLTLGPTSW